MANLRIPVTWSDFNDNLERVAYSSYCAEMGLLDMPDKKKLEAQGVKFSQKLNPFMPKLGGK